MVAAISGFGTALPPSAAQDELWQHFFREHFDSAALARRIFASSGVTHRHSVANPMEEDVSRWSTEQRMKHYARTAPPLGQRAVSAALADAALDPGDVGLFAVASCTGYSTPGLDIRLATELAMPATVQRLLIGHMGCYAALPGLGAVSDYVVARGAPAVLLCVELTSLHLQPPTGELAQVVAHALFADAAAAAVLLPPEAAGSRLELVDLTAFTDSATSEHMTWDVTDLGFRMGLSPKVPAVLAHHLRPVVTGLLARNGLALPDVAAWAVHPGGPRILETVEGELDLPGHALDESRDVLARCGNCSSATVLLILQALVRSGRLRDDDVLVALAFGPGLTLYAALLRCRTG